MDEHLIRQLVRQAIARHLGPPGQAPASAAPGASALVSPGPSATVPVTATSAVSHPSDSRFVLLRPVDETACVIEPAVACDHCGFCQCYGH